MVRSAIGLDTNSSSSDYIQLHAGDRATLAESLALIQQTATAILQALASDASQKDPVLLQSGAGEFRHRGGETLLGVTNLVINEEHQRW